MQYQNVSTFFKKKLFLFIITALEIHNNANAITNTQPSNQLEEIIVTAQKREQTLQDTPIAITVLDQEILRKRGISGLGDLASSAVTSLNIQPYANSPSTLVVSIRGNGPGDVGQTTRDSSVAIYLDEVYLGRSQALDFELVEIDRIEVLRGPQGTLYGRNATSGAINLISAPPAGELGIRQTFRAGRFNHKTSSTHLDFPEINNISSKLDFIYSSQDGWVENIDPDQADYNEFKKRGARFSTKWQASELLDINYSYSLSDADMSQNYYQFYRDFLLKFGVERNRKHKSRLGLPLKPSTTEQFQHNLTANWAITDTLQFKSITSYRELESEDQNNFGGAFYFNGVNDVVEVNQHQYSQELRLVGSHERFDWVAGLYYYDESIDEKISQFFSLDIFGSDNVTPITPPTTVDLFTGENVDPLKVISNLRSFSIYSQGTWTPSIVSDKLELTFGLRYTNEEKSGVQTLGGTATYELEDNRADPAFTAKYYLTDDANIYATWSQAFRSGGVNVRSRNLIPFDRERVDTAEIGLKFYAINRRLRVNAALFQTDYDDMFIDIFSSENLAINDTINAENTVEVDGAEFEATFQLLSNLTTHISYTYLDGDFPEQPDRRLNNRLEKFETTQTPNHSGTFAVDYTFPQSRLGELNAHIELLSRSQYHHYPSGGKARPDGYTLLNARLELSSLPIMIGEGDLALAIWGKNLSDEEYVVSSFHFEGISTIQAFGEPKTVGVDLSYSF